MRTNLVKNPSFELGTAGWSADQGTLVRAPFPQMGGQVGTHVAQVTVAPGTSTTWFGMVQAIGDATPVVEGQWVAARIWGAHDNANSNKMRLQAVLRGGTTVYRQSPLVSAGFYGGALHEVVFQVPAGTTSVVLQAQVVANSGSPVDGSRLWSDQVRLHVGATEAEVRAALAQRYFDGSTPDTERERFDWTGAAHASVSTATDWLDVSLVPAGSQIVLTGVPAGTAYEVTGTTGDGSSWPVPGGVGVSSGEQVVLVDNRSALNAGVTYQAVVAGSTYVSAPVTVTHPGRYVLQSLDGQTVVDFVWDDNGMPRDFVSNTAVFDIPGRARPPIRYAPGGDGGGSLRLRTNRQNTLHMRDLLRAGRPIVVRTDGGIRDLDAVDLIQVVGKPSNVLWAGDGGLSTQRVWSLEYVLVDDPEPSAVLSAWTWDDFDAAMTTRTWSQHDALFATSTWDQWDTYPWGQLL